MMKKKEKKTTRKTWRAVTCRVMMSRAKAERSMTKKSSNSRKSASAYYLSRIGTGWH